MAVTAPNQNAPLAVMFVDPASGAPYSLATGAGGSYLQATLPGATVNDWNPAGFTTAVPRVGRLDMVGTDQATTVNGLQAGSDGQLVAAFNGLATQAITLNLLNGGSQAANQFQGPGTSIAIAPGQTKFLMYYAGTINKWRVIG